MDILFCDYKASWRPLRLRRGQTVSVEAHRGTQIRSMRGELWITQEGNLRDYFVPAGMRYCADRAGHVVVSAVDHAAYASISWDEPEHAGTFTESTVRIDYSQLEHLQREARKAQAREIARLIRTGFNRITHVWRRFVPAIPSGRGPTMHQRAEPAGPPSRDGQQRATQAGAVRPCGATPVRQHG